MVQQGTPQQVYDDPATGFVAGLLGENNRLPGTVMALEGDECQVRLDCGPELWARRADAGGPGSRCIVAIRPERVAVAAMSAEEMGEGALAAALRDAIFLGDHVRLLLELGRGGVLVAKRPAGSRVPRIGGPCLGRLGPLCRLRLPRRCGRRRASGGPWCAPRRPPIAVATTRENADVHPADPPWPAARRRRAAGCRAAPRLRPRHRACGADGPVHPAAAALCDGGERGRDRRPHHADPPRPAPRRLCEQPERRGEGPYRAARDADRGDAGEARRAARGHPHRGPQQWRRPCQPHDVLGRDGRQGRPSPPASCWRRSTATSAAGTPSAPRSQRAGTPIRLRLGLRQRDEGGQAGHRAEAQPGHAADGWRPGAAGQRCLGARLLPALPEPPRRIHQGLVERGELGRGGAALRGGERRVR